MLGVRALIEKGREVYWSKYADEYANHYGSDECYVKKELSGGRDKLTNKPNYRTRPVRWADFVDFIQTYVELQGKPFLKLLEGGMGSDYDAMSDAIHNVSEEILAEWVTLLRDQSYVDLFEDVYNRDVGYVSVGRSSAALSASHVTTKSKVLK